MKIRNSTHQNTIKYKDKLDYYKYIFSFNQSHTLILKNLFLRYYIIKIYNKSLSIKLNSIFNISRT